MFQFFKAGRQNKHAYAVRHALHHLKRALNVDLQHDVHAAVKQFFHIGARRAVTVACKFGMFQKFIILHAPFKLLPGNKKVILSVHLALARPTRGCGNGICDLIGKFLKQLGFERPLSHAGRPGKDKQNAPFPFVHYGSSSSTIVVLSLISKR